MRYLDKGLNSGSKYSGHRQLILSMLNEKPRKSFSDIAAHLIECGLEQAATTTSIKSFCGRHFKDTAPATEKGFMKPYEDFIKALVLAGMNNERIREKLLADKGFRVRAATLSAFLRRRNYFKDDSPSALVHSHIMCKPWTAEGLSGMVAA